MNSIKPGVWLILFWIALLAVSSSCFDQLAAEVEGQRISRKKLNFGEDCLVFFDEINSIELNVPAYRRLERLSREGMCEYRFYYKDSSVFYVSTNVWFGSSLNFYNRDQIGHTAHRGDTSFVGGLNQDGLFWMEKIIGNYSYGYKNADERMKRLFDGAANSIVINP